MSPPSIKALPETERPREKLQRNGEASLSDTELLAALWGSGMVHKNILDLAQEQLFIFGGLQRLVHSNFEEFSQTPGCGLVKFAQLKAAFEIAKRCFFSNPSRPFHSFLKSHFQSLEYEQFGCLFLNRAHTLLQFEILSQGSAVEAFVSPRVLIDRALKYDASFLILVHNHPQKIPYPSSADFKLTKTLKHLLKILEMELLDHFIFCGEVLLSFKEKGWL